MKKIIAPIFWLIWAVGAGAILYYPVSSVLTRLDAPTESTGPLVILILAAQLFICLGGPILSSSIAEKLEWYSNNAKNKHIRVLRISFAIFCCLFSIPGVIKIGWLWLGQGLFGPFSGGCFIIVSLLQPIGYLAFIGTDEAPR